MNKAKMLVAYASKHGTTKQYAQWIAHALDAQLMEAKAVKPETLEAYDVVVYGGGLYAGGIAGVKLVAKNPCKQLVVFTVGLGNPETWDYSNTLKLSFPPEVLAKVKLFHLRGGMAYHRLGPLHKAAMAMMRASIMKKPEAQRTQDDRDLLTACQGQADFTDKAAIAPLVAYVEGLVGK